MVCFGDAFRWWQNVNESKPWIHGPVLLYRMFPVSCPYTTNITWSLPHTKQTSAWNLECFLFTMRFNLYFFPPRSARNFGEGGAAGLLYYKTALFSFKIKLTPLYASYTARTEHLRESVSSCALPLLSAHEANSRTHRTDFHEILHRRAELMCIDSIKSIGLTQAFLLENLSWFAGIL